MRRKISLLIVDDHPMIIQGYEHFLNKFNQHFEFNIRWAENCDGVINQLNRYPNFFDIILLDIRIPPSEKYHFKNGEDIGHYIKLHFKYLKVIIHSSIENHKRILSIIEYLRPEGFLAKCDITPEVLFDSIKTVLKGEVFYSNKIEDSIRIASNNVNIRIDQIDRKILSNLADGEKMKNLPSIVYLSMSTIERRVKQLRISLGVSSNSRKELISKAKKSGII